MTIGLPVPTRIKEDLEKNDGRALKQLLQNMKERIDSLERRITELESQ